MIQSLKFPLPTILFAVFLILPQFSNAQVRTGNYISGPQALNSVDPNVLASAILTSDTLQFLTNASFSGANVQAAAFTQSLQDFPIDSGSFLLLSSGIALQAPGVATDFASNSVGGGTGTSPDGFPAFDVAALTLNLNVPDDAQTISFDFKFGTEENPTFLGSGFQDFFTAKINNTENIALLPNGDTVTVDRADPFSNDVIGNSSFPTGELPSPNDVVYNAMLRNIQNASFDLTPFRGQSVAIEFQIGDAADSVLDSAAFIDNLRITRGAPPLNEAAANLAKELVNADYLYGGKGWDYNVNEFVSPNVIKNGYNFWNQSTTTPGIDFGIGVDCSGLVMWSYNRAFDPTKSRFNNFVKAEGADEQFRENTEPVNESQLAPGDVLFSDFDNNGFIDHVSMFVGESGGFDVVSAASPLQGIVPVSKNVLKQLPGFIAFKRVISAPTPKVLVTAASPVDLVVTDPDGFTITSATIIPSDLEFLRQIPGVLYYSEIEQGADGGPTDQVYSYVEKTGDYLIKVLPEPDALSTATFSLSFTTDLATTTVLAENVHISDIPDQSYILRVSEEGVEKIIPVKVKITPKTLNLGNKGTFSAIIEISKGFGASVADINAETVSINGAFPVKTTIAADKFLVATFKTQDLKNVPSGNEVELQVSGNFNDSTVFEGSDAIRIISRGRFSDTFGQFNHLAGVLAALWSQLSQLLELLQP